MPTLTASQEDYLETIYRLEGQSAAIRVSDIAARLGTRLPTVTRTVKRLTRQRLLKHDHRQEVSLSATGRRIAREIVHRHDDLVAFFRDFLGLGDKEAQENACRLEHGLSRKAAQRLHEFLEYWATLSQGERKTIERFLDTASKGHDEFKNISPGKTAGWRS